MSSTFVPPQQGIFTGWVGFNSNAMFCLFACGRGRARDAARVGLSGARRPAPASSQEERRVGSVGVPGRRRTRAGCFCCEYHWSAVSL